MTHRANAERRRRRDLALRYPAAAGRLAAAELDWLIRSAAGVRSSRNARGLSERCDHRKDTGSLGGTSDQPESWRAARPALRLQGREISQHDGAVYVDGVVSRDPALYAPELAVPA